MTLTQHEHRNSWLHVTTGAADVLVTSRAAPLTRSVKVKMMGYNVLVQTSTVLKCFLCYFPFVLTKGSTVQSSMTYI